MRTANPQCGEWADVRLVAATELHAGDRCVVASVGTAYRVAADGTVRGVGFMPLEGTVWTITATDPPGTITARRADGCEVVETPRDGATILRLNGTDRA